MSYNEAFPVHKLSSLCSKIGSGSTPRGGSEVYLKNGSFALIRSQNIRNDSFDRNGLVYLNQDQADKLANVAVESNDVLLNITGDSVARCCQVDNSLLPARVNQHVAIIRPNPAKLDPRFLRYVLISPKMQQVLLNLASAGATRNALTKGMIESLEIPLPYIEKQRAIADILGCLDDKIELNRQMCKTQEDIASTLFKSWFIDFEPVKAKAAGREPEGLSRELAELFPDNFIDSPLGKIPSGWKHVSLSTEFDLLMGQSPPGNTYNEISEGLPFFQGTADFGFRFPSNRIFCNKPNRIANTGQVLVSVRAPVGEVNVAIENCCIGRGVASVNHKSGSLSYTFYMMKALKNNFKSFEANGTVFGSIKKNEFENIKLIFSDQLRLIKEFENIAGIIDKKIERLSKHTLNLCEIRNFLLPRLISGSIRLKDI